MFHRRITLIPVLPQCLFDDPDKFGRRIGHITIKLSGFLPDDCGYYIDGALALKGRFARQHFKNNASEAKNITPAVKRNAAGLLGRHILWRTEY